MSRFQVSVTNFQQRDHHQLSSSACSPFVICHQLRVQWGQLVIVSTTIPLINKNNVTINNKWVTNSSTGSIFRSVNVNCNVQLLACHQPIQ